LNWDRLEAFAVAALPPSHGFGATSWRNKLPYVIRVHPAFVGLRRGEQRQFAAQGNLCEEPGGTGEKNLNREIH
jgi:hypothetical protein